MTDTSHADEASADAQRMADALAQAHHALAARNAELEAARLALTTETRLRQQAEQQLRSNSAQVPLNLREAELHLMQRALRETDGNVSAAARLLGVHRSRLYRVLG